MISLKMRKIKRKSIGDRVGRRKMKNQLQRSYCKNKIWKHTKTSSNKQKLWKKKLFLKKIR